ncbi:MAG: glycoside hydrolase 100 family protein [bacterium]
MITQKAYAKAVDVLEHCAKSEGFYASGLVGGYEAVWSRDSMITSLGAMFLGEKFKNTIKKSITTLGKHQSRLGQIPNCVGSYNTDRRSDVTYNSIDSTLWHIIGTLNYILNFNDKKFYKNYKEKINMSFLWLSYQDPDEVGLLAQQPTMDWQDAFPHKYGYCINTQALYYACLKLFSKDEDANNLKKIINGEKEKYISLYDKKLGYYYPWGWKNHDTDREHEEWFDTLGNLLAVITGLATPKIAKSIMKYIEREKINKPYPCKAIWPPIKKGDKEWKSYFSQCDAKDPYRYLNAGIWPYIGGFYIVALVKTKQYNKAKIELKKLAKANLQKLDGYEFNEWLDGKNGKPEGEPYQAWTAASYIYAYECVHQKKVFHFDY